MGCRFPQEFDGYSIKEGVLKPSWRRTEEGNGMGMEGSGITHGENDRGTKGCHLRSQISEAKARV